MIATQEDISIRQGFRFSRVFSLPGVAGDYASPTGQLRLRAKGGLADEATGTITIDLTKMEVTALLTPDQFAFLAPYGHYTYDIRLTHSGGAVDLFYYGRVFVEPERP